jgi:integrase
MYPKKRKYSLMATKAEKLKSGNYRVRTSYVDETGKQRFKSFTAETAKEAKYLALQFEVDHKHKAKPENISLREAMERFISNRGNLLSPATIKGYQQLKRNAYGSIIDRRLGNITTEDIQKAINEYAEEHSAKSVRNALALISTVLKKTYPSLYSDLIVVPDEEKKDIVIPTTEQVNSIIAATKGKPLYLPIILGALLGLRRSEIFALTWDDIDLEKNAITINKAKVQNEFREYVVKGTKTRNSRRTLTIPASIKEELLEMDKDKPLMALGVNQFSQRYRRLANKLNMPESFHALRHYNASIMLQLNVPNKYAMERMGHSTDNMLKKVYQHTFKSEQDLIADKLDEFFSGNINKED